MPKVTLTVIYSVRDLISPRPNSENDDETKTNSPTPPGPHQFPLAVYVATLRAPELVVCSFLYNGLCRFEICALRTRKIKI